MSYKKIAFLTAGLLMTHLSYGADPAAKPDTGLNSHKNPFTKNIPASAMIITPPGTLPVVNSNNAGMGLPTGSPRGLYGMDEGAGEQKTEWDNMKVVGYYNNHVILRIGSENNNNNVEPRTIFTDLNSKFFLNKNQYTIKGNNKTFSIYNKNNQMVHKLSLGNNTMRLIPRTTSSNGSANGAAPAAPTPTQQGANSGSGQ